MAILQVLRFMGAKYRLGGVKLKIPKNPNQAVNGLGVSIMALVMLLLFLPIATVGMMELSQVLGGSNNSVETPYSESTNFPANGSLSSHSSSLWLNSGDNGNCVEGSPRETVEIHNSYSYSSSVDLCNYAVQPATQKFASELWVTNWLCSDFLTTLNDDCGDDDYSIAISDWHMDYSSTITSFRYQALGLQLQVPCDHNNNNGLVGNISFQYSVSIQTQSYLPTMFNTFSWQVADYKEDIWQGVMILDNRLENTATGQCVIALEFTHELDFQEQIAYSQYNFEQFENGANPPLIYFIIDLDNFYDEDLNKPKTMSNIATPFEDYSSGGTSFYLQRFETTTIESESITTSSKFVSVFIGSIFWICGVASTPAWNPIADRVRGEL